MAAAKKTRRAPRRSALSPVIVMIGCKLDGKTRTLALRREGKRIRGAIFDGRATNVPQAVKGGLTLDFGDGEAMHTALHALGVWAWGSES